MSTSNWRATIPVSISNCPHVDTLARCLSRLALETLVLSKDSSFEMDQSNTTSQGPSEMCSPAHSASLSSDSGIQSPGNKERKPKRVLHCSDGVYEEYSSDEDGVYPVSREPLVDPRSMAWVPWLAHVSNKALAACDSVGEKVADFLGITSPKYSYEIEEAARMEEEARVERTEYDIEMAGWKTCISPDASSASPPPQTSTPISILAQPSANQSTVNP